jgi:hypothetical protein
MMIGISVPLVLVLIATALVVVPRFIATHAAGTAAAVNMDCTLIVPPNPLSAKGLATPYRLVATNPANGACHEANKVQAAFVQGAVIDRATGAISIYNPLVIDDGTQPAAAPVVPTLPARNVVAVWFGFNGNNLTLKSNNGSLQQGRCVNGVNNSIFGQFAYCNASRFFAIANRAIQNKQLAVPPLGMGNDGKVCPTVRDFGVVDMDQSDNVTTTYLVNGNGQVAQMTAKNSAALGGGGAMAPQLQVNASDNRLLSVALDGALGCKAWMAPDLADPGNMVPALPLDELQAAALQAAPIALVPAGDPMVLNNNNPDLNKINAYRIGVDQTPAQNLAAASTTTYCGNLMNVSPTRIQGDMQLTMNRPSPDAAVATNLFTFLGQRFNATFGANGLNCVGLLNKPNPATVTVDGNGVATAVTFAGAAGGNGNGNGGTTTTTTLTVNGTATQFANGQAQVTINKMPATATLNGAAVTITDGAANNKGANGNGNANGAGAAAPPTLTVNGTAVQFTNGQAQVTINKQPATATLNGTSITITDGAANNGGNGNGGNGGNGGGTTTNPTTCTLNGTAIPNCTVTINGQTCTITNNATTNQVSINCTPANGGQQGGGQQGGGQQGGGAQATPTAPAGGTQATPTPQGQ